ncbi:unnamed protein product [Tuber melanosporum]|uniref:DNA-directed RNA polymerase subunit n=1 Tax=Tuber melanosporum (strain Mel28) TaxID=656061 RepID=D5GKX5_TUBMM|nr:uncharacterized protein GSTUM_00009812001 [Tuber melanosporum]CAZ85168.1 unnamed protein product [Tuber melanosporum]
MPTPTGYRDHKHKKRDKNHKRKRLANSPPETSKKARTTTTSSPSPKHHGNASSSASAAPDSPANKTPYHAIRASLYLTLSPKYSYKTPQSPHTTPLSGIQKDHLDPLLMSYFEPVNGVVLAYRNISFENDCARIVGESPFAHVWVFVEFLVWRPVRGMLLKGWVNMAGASHVGLLVENTWNVAIPRERIPESWSWVEEVGMEVNGEGAAVGEGAGVNGGYWVDGDGKKIEAFRKFKIEAVKAMGHMVSMEGSLLGVERREKKPRRERAG